MTDLTSTIETPAPVSPSPDVTPLTMRGTLEISGQPSDTPFRLSYELSFGGTSDAPGIARGTVTGTAPVVERPVVERAVVERPVVERPVAESEPRGVAPEPAPTTGESDELLPQMLSHVGHVLRTPTGKIDPDRSLRELGLDSLMALEVKNRLQGAFGTSVPTKRIMSGASLRDLSAELQLSRNGRS